MGFGLCVLGYLLTVLDTFYAGIIGWPLLAFGFFRLSRTEKSFAFAGAMSVLCTVYSAADILVLLKVIDGEGALYFALHLAYIALGACIHLVYLLSVRSLATRGGDMNIALRALIWLGFSELYYICSAVSAVTVFGADALPYYAQVLGNVVLIMKYAIGFTNLWFLYGCYAKITTAERIEKDEAMLKEIAEKEAAKRRRRKEDK